MLSLERAKELLNDPTLSDEEVLEIRDGFYQLSEIIFEKWQEDKKAGKLNTPSRQPLNAKKATNMPSKGLEITQKRPLYLKK